MSSLHDPLHFPPGRVLLVGAGPGDPDLLTIKALRAILHADLVLYDHLVSDAVLQMVPSGAERLYVGKASGSHSLAQDDICALMVRLARSGRSLVRLKGGDPLIFGRGGEEAEALARAGIPFEFIPGISSAQGAAAQLGLPLTHRDHAHALLLVTGHLREDGRGEAADVDWASWARPQQTLVIYMGLGRLEFLSRKLIEHGLPAGTPAALIERATTPQQRWIAATVATLPERARTAQVRAPALIVVGTVVQAREDLQALVRSAAHPLTTSR